MAQAAAGAGSSTNSNSENDDDVSCVYDAVAARETADRVRELIERYASAGGAHAHHALEYEARRAAVVSYESSAIYFEETPLEAAHGLGRGDLVAALLENGADAKALGPRCNALALAVHYGQAETLRVLLRSGRHRANETV